MSEPFTQALNFVIAIPVIIVGIGLVLCGVFPFIDALGVALKWWPK